MSSAHSAAVAASDTLLVVSDRPKRDQIVTKKVELPIGCSGHVFYLSFEERGKLPERKRRMLYEQATEERKKATKFVATPSPHSQRRNADSQNKGFQFSGESLLLLQS